MCLFRIKIQKHLGGLPQFCLFIYRSILFFVPLYDPLIVATCQGVFFFNTFSIEKLLKVFFLQLFGGNIFSSIFVSDASVLVPLFLHCFHLLEGHDQVHFCKHSESFTDTGLPLRINHA